MAGNEHRNDLERRVAELEARLARLEARLEQAPDEHLIERLTEQPEPEPVHTEPPPLPEPEDLAPLPAPVAPPSAPISREQPADTPRWRRIPAATQGPADTPRARSLERLVGERWAMIAGALVVVIGVGLFFKLAWDQGWLKLVAPWLRCALGAAFGALLLAAGEIVRRRIGDRAAAGITAAGIGVVYTSAYAAYALYALVPAAGAFAMLVLVAAVGIAIAARARLASVGVVSLVGGYLTPILLAGSDAPPWFLPAYLVALLATGLVLSGWLGGRFESVRSTAWWGTAILGLLWTGAEGPEHLWIALALYATVWSCVHTELIWSGRRPHAARTGPDWLASWRRARLPVTSCATTIWSVGLGVAVARAAGGDGWIAPALGLVGALAAIQLSGGGYVRLLREPPRGRLAELRATLAVQGGALAVAAIALGLVGWLEVAAWAAIGAAAVWASRNLRAGALAVYGLGVLVALLAKLLAYDSLHATGGIDVAGLHITRWWGQMAVVGAAITISGWRLLALAGKRWRVTAQVALAAGPSAVVAGLLHDRSELLPLTGAGLALGLMITILARLLRSLGLHAYAIAVLAVASLAIFPTEWWLAPGAHAAGLVLTPATGVLAFACLAWAACARLLLPLAEQRLRPAAIALATIAPACLMLGLLHEDANDGIVILAWTAIALAALALGLAEPRLALDRVAVGLLGAAATLWLVAYPARGWSTFSAPALAHPGLIVLFLHLCAAVGALVRVRAVGAPLHARWIAAGAGMIVALAFLASTLEVARVAELATADPNARRAAVSLWWGVFAIGLIGAGFWRRLGLPRYAGLALIGVAVLKALVFDLVGVTPAWRVASVIGLGLLLLGVAAAYARLSSRLNARPSD